jgi:hypothetical protein
MTLYTLEDLKKITSAMMEANEVANQHLIAEIEQLRQEKRRFFNERRKDRMFLTEASRRNRETQAELEETKLELNLLKQTHEQQTVRVNGLEQQLRGLSLESTPRSVQIQVFRNVPWIDMSKAQQRDSDVLNPKIQGTYFIENRQVNGAPVYSQHKQFGGKVKGQIEERFFIAKNSKGQWTVSRKANEDMAELCVAYDPEPKELPWNCNWHEWDEQNKVYVSMNVKQASLGRMA